jgi:hypothetical protein
MIDFLGLTPPFPDSPFTERWQEPFINNFWVYMSFAGMETVFCVYGKFR